ncbi:glycogen debranching protein GlgX [Thermoplasmatales archaeon AK]|nr:glycogen debranching protein GlgX [Thermoplasmatales archaeon AK]
MLSPEKIRRGFSYPLGATLRDNGVNFAVYSENAEEVYLELFNTDDGDPVETIQFKEHDGYVWHTFVSGIGAGQYYGYRMKGAYDPISGKRFNDRKLLIDPYTKALSGVVRWDNSLFSYNLDSPDQDLSINTDADYKLVPKGIVVDSAYDWNGVKKPFHPWNRTIIYETHVKGATFRREDIPQNIRGTYSGLASDPMIQYFTDLGITSIELMPVHHHVDDKLLADAGLVNYWGYNTIAFFAPDVRYCSGKPGSQVKEFKDMVRKLHENGIEVILDVVYNHTAEGNHLGPTLSFRGLDNTTYYVLDPQNPRYYVDFTGTGNSLDARNPQVLQLIMDSLRYWATEMQADGFRFDLASTLARELYDVNMLSPFLNTIHQDPVVSNLKLIAEPWDVGPGGYQVGNFPPKWAEWNGKYRDLMRRFWRGDLGLLGEFATRLSGSPDLYQENGRRPFASINFITSHDGFTMYDLVSYNQKHNELNGAYPGGMDENYSYNCGIEGETGDPGIIGRRFRMIKNYILTLLVSQGTPMILGGDEIARTQRGNNNAFCQDNEISWYDWNFNQEKRALLKFTRHVISLRRSNPVLRRRNFFRNTPVPGSNMKEILWLDSQCREMTQENWNDPGLKSIMVWLSGRFTSEVSYVDDVLIGGDLILLFNASDEAVDFKLPHSENGWELYVDTNLPSVEGLPMPIPGENYVLNSSASAVIQERRN